MPTFVVKVQDRYMYIHPNGAIQWVKDKAYANTYSSKYQAKRHKQMLDNVPVDAKIEELAEVAQR